jgi:hypothetical protein
MDAHLPAPAQVAIVETHHHVGDHHHAIRTGDEGTHTAVEAGPTQEAGAPHGGLAVDPTRAAALRHADEAVEEAVEQGMVDPEAHPAAEEVRAVADDHAAVATTASVAGVTPEAGAGAAIMAAEGGEGI